MDSDPAEGRRRDPSWEEIAEDGRRMGWFPEAVGEDKVVLERGRQRIIAHKLLGTDKWKVEYFSGKIMDDTTGAETEYFAKRLAIEMLLFK